MNKALLGFVLITMMACSAGRHLQRVPQVQPLAMQPLPVDLSRDVGRRADADHSSPDRSAPALPERLAGGPSSEPVYYRSDVRGVATPTDIEHPQRDAAAASRVEGWHAFTPYDPAGYVGYYGPCDLPGPAFPVHAFIGASIGSAIGHHNGHGDHGAWIGAGVGFLLDLRRFWR